MSALQAIKASLKLRKVIEEVKFGTLDPPYDKESYFGFKAIEPKKIGKISSIHIYPIKSCAGIELEDAKVTQRGLETISSKRVKDREYMIVDAMPEIKTKHHKFLTQRDRGLQKMAKIKPKVQDERLLVSWESQDAIAVPDISHGKEIPVRVHSYFTTGIDQGDDIAKMLSEYLERKVRLVRAGESFNRPASQHYARNPNTLSYQDAYSLNWLFSESVKELEVILGYGISTDSFRPNIVAFSGTPNLEHLPYHLAFGEVQGFQPKPGTRCMIINVDPKTAIIPKGKRSPLRAVFDNYCWVDMNGQRQAIFAENFLPTSEGKISRSEEIVMSSERDPPLAYNVAS